MSLYAGSVALFSFLVSLQRFYSMGKLLVVDLIASCLWTGKKFEAAMIMRMTRDSGTETLLLERGLK